MKTSRQQLFDFIKNHHLVVTAEISRALNMTEANVRHHLTILQNQGLVEVVGSRRTQGKGRPAHLFRISRQSMGHNLDKLAGALLSELNQSSETNIEDLLQNVACRLVDKQIYRGAGKRFKSTLGDHFVKRLHYTIEYLNKLNYRARWEAHSESPRIILGYCPYADILPEHPELCSLDCYLLEELLGAPVTQISKLTTDERGIPSCTFRVEIASPARSNI
jgi:predicted ArsR family transcriptional regulator